MAFDYSSKLRIVADIKNMHFGHYVKIDVSTVDAGFFLYQEAFSSRLCGLHLVNSPYFIDLFLKMLKVALPPKVTNKLTASPDWESFYNIVPQEDLPTDFGGKQGYIKDIKGNQVIIVYNIVYVLIFAF